MSLARSPGLGFFISHYSPLTLNMGPLWDKSQFTYLRPGYWLIGIPVLRTDQLTCNYKFTFLRIPHCYSLCQMHMDPWYWLHLCIIIVDVSLQPLCIVLYLLYVVSHGIRNWVFPKTSGLSLLLLRNQYPGITCDRQSLDYWQWSIHSFTYAFFGSFIYPSDWELLIFQAYHVETSRSVFIFIWC